MRWASIPGRTSANACLSARGGPASGLASRISTRRSVYFHASMRRCGRPAASKRRNAASRGPAWSRRPGRRALTAAKLSARPVSAAVLMRGVSTFMALCRLVLVSSIALGFELESELLAAGAHDAALRQHMHDIRHDMVEEPLIMGDDDHGALGRAQPVDAVRHHLEGVDVEAGIGLVEHAQLGLEQRHLENLVALLLAAGESDIDRPAQHLLVDVELLRRLAHPLEEVGRRQLRLAALLALGVERGAQERHVGDAGNLEPLLKSQEI